MVLSQSLIGAGAVRSVTFVSIITQWGLFIPGAYLAAVIFGGDLLALWIAQGCWRLLFALLMIALFRLGRWKQVVV